MSFHEIFNTLIYNRKIIIRLTVLTAVFLFLLLFFVYPVTYSSAVRILPPQENKQSGLSALLGGTDFGSMLSMSPAGNSQLYAEVIKSRSAAEYVVDKCRLFKYLKTENKYIAAARLGEMLSVEVSKEGIITAAVDVQTPWFPVFSSKKDSAKILSADIANSFAEALDKLNQEKLNSKTRRTREFLENQLLTVKSAMDSAEVTLKNFQEENKAISLPEQLTAAIETASKIKSEIIFTEIQLGTVKSSFVGTDKSEDALKIKLDQLKKQYAQIEAGEKLNSDYLPSFSNIPRVSLELARLMREVRIQNELYLQLQKQFYTEKVQENKDIPTIEVLDKAIIPLKAKGPRVLFHTAFGTLFAFSLVSAFILFTEHRKRSKVVNKIKEGLNV